MARYIGNDRVLTVQVSTTTPNTLTIGAGAAGVRYTEKTVGGTVPSVAHAAAATANAPTSVAVSGDQITVTLGTGATGGTPNATAQQVVDAVNAHAGASALVTASNVGDGTGTAVAAAMAPLAGGGATVTEFVEAEFQTSLEISGENESIDSSHKGTNHAESFAGQASDSLSFECYEDDDELVAVAQAQLKRARALRALVTVREEKKSYDAQGNVTALVPLIQNFGRITSLSTSKNLNEMATFSVEMELQDFWQPVAQGASAGVLSAAVEPNETNEVAANQGQAQAQRSQRSPQQAAS